MNHSTAFFPIDLEELQHFIRTTIQETVRISTPPPAASQHSELLTKKEAMKFLGDVSTPTFDKLVKEGKINKYKPTEGRVVFLRSQLMAYVITTKV